MSNKRKLDDDTDAPFVYEKTPDGHHWKCEDHCLVPHCKGSYAHKHTVTEHMAHNRRSRRDEEAEKRVKLHEWMLQRQQRYDASDGDEDEENGEHHHVTTNDHDGDHGDTTIMDDNQFIAIPDCEEALDAVEPDAVVGDGNDNDVNGEIDHEEKKEDEQPLPVAAVEPIPVVKEPLTEEDIILLQATQLVSLRGTHKLSKIGIDSVTKVFHTTFQLMGYPSDVLRQLPKSFKAAEKIVSRASLKHATAAEANNKVAVAGGEVKGLGELVENLVYCSRCAKVHKDSKNATANQTCDGEVWIPYHDHRVRCNEPLYVKKKQKCGFIVVDHMPPNQGKEITQSDLEANEQAEKKKAANAPLEEVAELNAGPVGSRTRAGRSRASAAPAVRPPAKESAAAAGANDGENDAKRSDRGVIHDMSLGEGRQPPPRAASRSPAAPAPIPVPSVRIQAAKCSKKKKVMEVKPLATLPTINLRKKVEQLLSEPSFLHNIQHWLNRPSSERRSRQDGGRGDELVDIYDARIWKEHKMITVKYSNPNRMPNPPEPFLHEDTPFNLAFSICVDWFQPYDHTCHSTGAIQIAILNLPRHLRYLKENIIVFTVIPGPKEPSTMEYILDELVRQLDDLYYNPIRMKINTKHLIRSKAVTEEKKEMEQKANEQPVPVGGEVMMNYEIRCMLLALNCDLPASRKVSGHAGHGGKHGCARCKEEFLRNKQLNKQKVICTPDFETKQVVCNIGGIPHQQLWRVHPSGLKPAAERTDQEHRANMKAYHAQKSKSKRKDMRKKNGAHYTPLMKLLYFDTVRMVTIDPLHNLFLGSAKNVWKRWVGSGDVTKEQLQKMQQFIRQIKLPKPLSRLPGKLYVTTKERGFSNMNGSEWKAWTLVYSEAAMDYVDITPAIKRVWKPFVNACLLVSKVQVDEVDLYDAEYSFGQFHLELQRYTQGAEEKKKEEEEMKKEKTRLTRLGKFNDADEKKADALAKEYDKDMEEFEKKRKKQEELKDGKQGESEDQEEKKNEKEKKAKYDKGIMGAWCTPNVHQSLHLCEMIRDYGPISSFWGFGFERVNGVLTNVPHNNRDIQGQLFNYMIQMQQVASVMSSLSAKQVPNMIMNAKSRDRIDFTNEDFRNAMKEFHNDINVADGSEIIPGGEGIISKNKKFQHELDLDSCHQSLTRIIADLKTALTKWWTAKHPNVRIQLSIVIDNIIKRWVGYKIGGELFNTKQFCPERSWIYTQGMRKNNINTEHVAQILDFYTVQVSFNQQPYQSHTLAYVHWFKQENARKYDTFVKFRAYDHEFMGHWQWLPLCNVLGYLAVHESKYKPFDEAAAPETASTAALRFAGNETANPDRYGIRIPLNIGY